jgi:hypothetical protein
MKRVFILFAGVLVLLAGTGHAQTAAPARPTATEVFHLRSACAALGEKLVKDSQFVVYPSGAAEAHYDVSDNRCYVQLKDFQPHGSSISLVDAQSREVLAHLMHFHDGSVSGWINAQDAAHDLGMAVTCPTVSQPAYGLCAANQAARFIHHVMQYGLHPKPASARRGDR